MFIPSSQTPDLLKRLKEENDRNQPLLNKEFGLDGLHAKSQELLEVEPIVRGIPALERNIYKPASEMLQHRFRFAGAWKDALLGIRFLSLSEMEDVWTNPRIQEQIKNRKEFWEESPLIFLPESEVSLFGIGCVEFDEIYLLWGQSAEPRVLTYISNVDEQFENLADFILFYCENE